MAKDPWPEQDGTMDIYSKAGTKVVYLEAHGHDYEREHYAKLGLKKGEVVTVSQTHVHSSKTEVFFVEYGDFSFNSVCFAPYEPVSEVVNETIENPKVLRISGTINFDCTGKIWPDGEPMDELPLGGGIVFHRIDLSKLGFTHLYLTSESHGLPDANGETRYHFEAVLGARS